MLHFVAWLLVNGVSIAPSGYDDTGKVELKTHLKVDSGENDPGLIKGSFYDSKFRSDVAVQYSTRMHYRGYLVSSITDSDTEKVGIEYAKEYKGKHRGLSQPIIVVEGGTRFLIRREQDVLYAKDVISCLCVKFEKVNLNNPVHIKALTIENFLKTRGYIKHSYVYDTVVTYSKVPFSERPRTQTLTELQWYVLENRDRMKRQGIHLVPGINLPVAFFLNPYGVEHYFTGSTVMTIPVRLKKKMDEVPKWVKFRLGTDSPLWIRAARLRLKGLSFEEFFKQNGYLPGDRSWKDMVYNFDLRNNYTPQDLREAIEADPYAYDYYGSKGYGTFGRYTEETTNIFALEMWRYRHEAVTANHLVDKYLGIQRPVEEYDALFDKLIGKDQRNWNMAIDLSKLTCEYQDLKSRLDKVKTIPKREVKPALPGEIHALPSIDSGCEELPMSSIGSN